MCRSYREGYRRCEYDADGRECDADERRRYQRVGYALKHLPPLSELTGAGAQPAAVVSDEAAADTARRWEEVGGPHLYDAYQICQSAEDQVRYHASSGLDISYEMAPNGDLVMTAGCAVGAAVRTALGGGGKKRITHTVTVRGPADADADNAERDLADVFSDIEAAAFDLVNETDRERGNIADQIKPIIENDLRARLQKGLDTLGGRHKHTALCGEDEYSLAEHDARVIIKGSGWRGEIRSEMRRGIGEVWVVEGADRWSSPAGDVVIRPAWWAECKSPVDSGRVIEVMGR